MCIRDRGYIKKGFTVTGETYEELGKAMGVDEAAFAETMKTWNGYVEAKNDPDFGRTSFANKLDTAPYYAIKVTAGVHHTMGGLTINTNTEVLKEDGTVIPGLFAAGAVSYTHLHGGGNALEAGRAVGLQNFALNVIAQGLLSGQQVAHALQCLCFHKMVPLYINQCKYFYLIHYKEICRFVN